MEKKKKFTINHFWRTAGNLLLAAVWVRFTFLSAQDFLMYGNISSLLIALTNGLIVFMFVSREKAAAVSKNYGDWLAALICSVLPFFFIGDGLPDPWQGKWLMIFGTALELWSFASLNRSLGVVPALRSIKTKGLYAFVRHPIYASYLLVFGGFYLCNPLPFNFTALIALFSLLALRALREETIMARDPAYVAYEEKVPWRLIPFIY